MSTETTAPLDGYILDAWHLTHGQKSTAIVYLKQKGFEGVRNQDGNTYTLEQLTKPQ